MAGLNIQKVNALPAVLVADTLYLVKSAESGLFDLYMVDRDGVTVRHIATKDELTSSIILFSDTPPALPNAVLFWWHTAEGTLYVQYNDGLATHWVEAMPSISVPDFAGNGESNTMARSDHHHDDRYAMTGEHQW